MIQSAAELDVAEYDAAAVKNFTYTLAHVTGAEEAQLLAGLEERQVVQKAVDLARQQDKLDPSKVVQSVLGALVNLACIGGVKLIKEQGGFDLMLDQLESVVPAVQMYAVAGIQNTGRDSECAWKVVLSGKEMAIAKILVKTDNEQLKRFATGALANIKAVKDSEPPPSAAASKKGKKNAKRTKAEVGLTAEQMAALLADAMADRKRKDQGVELRKRHASATITLGLRNYLTRCRARIVLQAAARGRTDRAHAAHLRHERNAATTVQAARRGVEGRRAAVQRKKDRAATSLQSARRGNLGRAEVATRRRERDGATAVQTRVRGAQSRAATKRRRGANVGLQAAFRRAAAIRLFKTNRNAACTLQAHKRAVRDHRHFQAQKGASKVITRHARGYNTRLNIKWGKAAEVIQLQFRAVSLYFAYRHLKRRVLLVQSGFRRRKAIVLRWSRWVENLVKRWLTFSTTLVLRPEVRDLVQQAWFQWREAREPQTRWYLQSTFAQKEVLRLRGPGQGPSAMLLEHIGVFSLAFLKPRLPKSWGSMARWEHDLTFVLTRSPRATAAGDAAPAAPLNAVRSRGSQPLARNVKMPLIDPDRFKVGRSHSTNGQRHGTLRHNALAGDPSRRRPEPAARLPASADSAPPRRPSPPSSLPRLPVIGDSRKRAEKDSATRVAPKAKQAVQQLPRVANGTGRPRA